MAGRQQSAPSVSLFPFLAVLVCTMGALILILLVTTRRIHQQARYEAEAAARRAVVEHQTIAAATQPVAASTPVAIPVVEPVLPPAIEEPVVAVPSPAPSADFPQPETPAVYAMTLRPPRLAPKKDPGPDPRVIAQREAHERAQAKLTAEWEGKVDQLTRQLSETQSAARALEEQIRDRQRAIDALAGQLAGAEQQQQSTANDNKSLQLEVQLLTQRREAMQKEIDEVSARLKVATDRRKTIAATAYTFVPFDTISGTTRRPIVIECRSDRLIFVSEGISLSPQELEGYIPSDNPLRAGVQALCEIWQRRDSAQKEPYILFIVRPDGTVSFYIARMFLESLQKGFGYELVPADQNLAWPQSDDELVNACRNAIDNAKANRPRFSQRSPGRRGDPSPGQLRGAGGEFQLEEIERLRQPARSVSFGGQQIQRGDYTLRRSGSGAQGGTVGGRGISGDGGTSSVMTGERRSSGTSESLPAPRTASHPGAPSGTPSGAEAGPENETDESQESRWNPFRKMATNREEKADPSGLARSTEELASSAGDGYSDPLRTGNPVPSMPQPSAGAAPQPPVSARRPLGAVPFGSGISYQKDVKILVEPTQFQVEDQRPIAWPQGRLTGSQATQFSSDIERELRSWGTAPRGFVYRPRLLFFVAPGATPQYIQLKALASEWGVDHEVRYGTN